MPPLGEASACSSSGRLSTRQCGVRVAAHSAARSTAVRGGEEPLEAVDVRGGALLEHREDRPAVVVDDHDRQVRLRLVGAEDQAVGVVQEGHVAHQRDHPAARGPPERGPDRGGDHAVDAGQPPVGDHLAPRPDLPAVHHQVEVADRARGADVQQPLRAAGHARPHPPRRTASGRARRPAARSSCRETERSAASQASSQAGSAACWSGCGLAVEDLAVDREGGPPTRRAPAPRAPRRRRGASSRVTGRLRVGWPGTTTRSMLRPRSVSSSSR